MVSKFVINSTMINYNPRRWFPFLFRFHKSDTLRTLSPVILILCFYSWLLVYLEREYLHLPENSFVKNIPAMHSLLGFAISMLLVFRTNTAYDRWWEGRKFWGALVNNSRNLSMKLSAFLPKEEAAQRAFFQKIIPAYAFTLHNHLHSEKIRVELFEEDS